MIAPDDRLGVAEWLRLQEGSPRWCGGGSLCHRPRTRYGQSTSDPLSGSVRRPARTRLPARAACMRRVTVVGSAVRFDSEARFIAVGSSMPSRAARCSMPRGQVLDRRPLLPAVSRPVLWLRSGPLGRGQGLLSLLALRWPRTGRRPASGGRRCRRPYRQGRTRLRDELCVARPQALPFGGFVCPLLGREHRPACHLRQDPRSGVTATLPPPRAARPRSARATARGPRPTG